MSKQKSTSKSTKFLSQKKSSTPDRSNAVSALQWVVLAGILLLTLIVYWPTFQNGFVWDDMVYIQRNPLIYTLDIRNIFSSYLAGNYHPLTVLVHALEYHFFEFKETGYHVVNVVLHLINTVLVFYLIRKLSYNVWISLVTALLFGIHPMHVESVAWIAELKDVLYTMFFLASLIAYLRYAEKPGLKWYLIAILLFTLSLLSKGMAVSLPVVLILMDYFKGRLSEKRIWLEKIPFFILSIIFGIVAIAAQQAEAALHADTIPLVQRIVFAFYGYITYIQKLIFPVPLSAYYAYPIGSRDPIPAIYYLYIVLTIGLIVLTLTSLRKSKKIFFGVGFFSVTIFLVLKLLPVGYTVMADRYAYVASIGIFYLVAEGLNWLYHKKPGSLYKTIAAIAGIALTVFYSYTTFHRSQVWKNGLTLWSDTIDKDDRVQMAFLNRGVFYLDSKNYEASEKDLNRAIELDPTYAKSYYNRGMVYQQTRRYEAALADYNQAIQLNPNLASTYINRGNVYKDLNNFDQALADYNKAIDLDPTMLEPYNNKALMLQNQGNMQGALDAFSKALELSPTYLSALVNRGNLYSRMNQFDLSMKDYNMAISINPQMGSAYYARGLLQNKLAETSKACADFQQAVRFGYENAQNALNQFCK